MRPNLVISACALTVLLNGCTGIQKSVQAEQKFVIEQRVTGEKTNKPGQIFIWPPYASAAIVDDKGNRCVLAASGAKTFQAKAEAGLKLEGLDKVLGSSKLDATQKEELVEAFTKLSQQDADGAFVDIALFHLCMMDQNGTFGTNEKTGELKLKADLLLKAFVETVAIARTHAPAVKREGSSTPPPMVGAGN